MFNKIDLTKASQISLILIGLVVLVAILQRFSSILRPLSIGILLTFLFTPILRMSNKEKYKVVGKIIATILIFIIVVGGIVHLSFTTISELRNDPAFQSLQQSSFLDASISLGDQRFVISEMIDTEGTRTAIKNTLQSGITSFFTFISELLLVLVFLIFLVPLISKTIRDSKSKDKSFLRFSEQMERSISGYFKTKFLISLGTAATSYVVLLLFGVRLALAFALIMFLFNFIPTFGDYITLSIIILTQLIAMGFGLKLLGLVACLLAIQMVFGNYIEPKYSGKNLSVPPIMIILSLFFWGAIWGVGGMLFAVPLTVGARTIFNNLKSHIS